MTATTSPTQSAPPVAPPSPELPVHLTRFVSHAALGERAQALRAYRRFADKLQAELEVEPGNATVKLYERLQAG